MRKQLFMQNVFGPNIIQGLIAECSRLTNLAYTDELTGLPNWRKFQEFISIKMKNKSNFALLFMDINKFKKINDQYGHVVGDYLLIKCAERFRHIQRKDVHIFRKSGDEFLIIIEDVNKVSAIQDDIQKIFLKHIEIDQHQFLIQMSIGVGIYPENGNCIESLLKYADQKMYQKKKRNNISLKKKRKSHKA